MTQDPTRNTLGSRRIRTVSAVTAATPADEFPSQADEALNQVRPGPKPTGMKPAEVIAAQRAMVERIVTGADPRPEANVRRSAPKPAAPARKLAPAAMSTREQTIALTNQFTAFAAAGLPHVDPDLLAPVVAIALHDPTTGDLIGGVQLPEELADTLFQALDAMRRAQEDAAPAEHSRAADTAPVRRAFSVLPGGAA